MLSVACGASDFWTIIIPQASWKHAEIKELLLAIASLDRHMLSPASSLAVTGYYQKALQHYTKGLKGLSRGSPALDNILVSSILAWMFELIIAKIENANIHFTSAQRIIDELHIRKGGYLS